MEMKHLPDVTEMKQIKRYYKTKQNIHHAKKQENSGQIPKTNKQTLKQIQKGRENFNNHQINNLKNLRNRISQIATKHNTLGPCDFTGKDYQELKEGITPILHKIFQIIGIRKGKTYFCESSITLILKPDMGNTGKQSRMQIELSNM